jgi:hypothetical protein
VVKRGVPLSPARKSLFNSIGCIRFAITKDVDAWGFIEDCMRILHAAYDPHAAL